MTAACNACHAAEQVPTLTVIEPEVRSGACQCARRAAGGAGSAKKEPRKP